MTSHMDRDSISLNLTPPIPLPSLAVLLDIFILTIFKERYGSGFIAFLSVDVADTGNIPAIIDAFTGDDYSYERACEWFGGARWFPLEYGCDPDEALYKVRKKLSELTIDSEYCRAVEVASCTFRNSKNIKLQLPDTVSGFLELWDSGGWVSG